MERIDKIFSKLILGSIFPLLLGLLAVIVWFYIDGSESTAVIYLVIGLLLGILIDLKFLTNWVSHRFKLPVWFMAAIYICYNILVYGFFMGFPVFNVFLGLLAGYYFGNRICHKNIHHEMQSKLINQVSLFTGLVMTLICISSGFIALSGVGVGSDIKGMLGLNFEITKTMILEITLIGGLFLILVEILLTRLTIIKTIKMNTRLQHI